MLIFHLARREEWAAAQRTGRYGGSDQDRADGFIHFSTAETVSESAARHRAGESDLVLIAVESEPLKDALRWETARGGMLFPHLYGALPIERVKWVKELPLGADGRHVFPPLD
jgi:uncharacterized protein (DUF952 family)